jgi:hypothetical protein
VKSFGFINDEWQDGDVRGLVSVEGMRGYGKTTEMGRLAGLCQGRALFIDPEAKHKQCGFQIATQPGEAIEVLKHPRGRVLYQPREGNLDDHFSAVCKAAYIIEKVILFVDEMDKFCGSRFGDTRMPPVLYDITNYGRHHKISMAFTSREPMRVARGLTSASHEFKLFHFDEDDYIKYFQKRIGKVNAERLRSLPKYQYLHWKNDGSPVTIENAGRIVRS